MPEINSDHCLLLARTREDTGYTDSTKTSKQGNAIKYDAISYKLKNKDIAKQYAVLLTRKVGKETLIVESSLEEFGYIKKKYMLGTAREFCGTVRIDNR